MVGLCIVHRCAMEPSLLEYLRIARDKIGEARRDVWSALLRAAAAEASATSDRLVTLTDPEDRSLARAAGLLAAQPRRYAIVTIEREGGGVRHAIEDILRQSDGPRR